MEKTLTTRQMRERKFLGWVPAAVVPLITVLFWASGGGRAASAIVREVAKGWNMRLPGAYLARLSKLSKLEYYDQALKDTMARRQRLRIEDNYAKQMGIGSEEGPVKAVKEKLAEVERLVKGGRVAPTLARRTVGLGDQGAARLPRGLAAEDRGLEVKDRGLEVRARGAAAANLEKLERVMGSLRVRESEGDPEIAQLSALLDKLVAVQRVPVDTGRPRVEAGATGLAGAGISRRVLLPVRVRRDAEDTLGMEDTTVIEAMVPEEQVLVSGGELRLELAKDIIVGGEVVACGTPVYGIAALSGERLRVSVTSINCEGRVLPVNLAIADQDGLTGIYVPGAPAADAVHESAEQDVGLLEPAVLSTTLAGQATTAGMGLARSLISKKVRSVKVTVPAGYRVILHEQNNGL
jgi:hypothetical protein